MTSAEVASAVGRHRKAADIAIALDVPGRRVDWREGKIWQNDE